MTSSPTKKKTGDTTSKEYKITQIENDSSLINPCVVVFPYNYPSIDGLNNPKETKWEFGQNKEKKSKDDKSLLGINDKIIYEARTKPTANRSDYIWGVISKKTKREIKFVDIDSIFNMNQKIRKIEENTDKTLKIEDNIGADKLDLMANFGTAKAQKMALNMRTNIVSESNIASVNSTKHLLKFKAEENEWLNADNEKHISNSMLDILPKFNPVEKDVSKVFDIDSIIANQIVYYINSDELKEIIEKKEKVDKRKYCEFIYDYLNMLAKTGRHITNKIKYCIYWNEWIMFYNKPKVIRDNALKGNEGIDAERLEVMLGKYTQKTIDASGRVNYLKNQGWILKNIYDILVLALLLNGYTFDFTLLAKSMKMDNKTITSYFKEIGCTFKHPKDSKDRTSACVVQLKAPLKWGKPRYSKK